MTVFQETLYTKQKIKLIHQNQPPQLKSKSFDTINAGELIKTLALLSKLLMSFRGEHLLCDTNFTLARLPCDFTKQAKFDLYQFEPTHICVILMPM